MNITMGDCMPTKAAAGATSVSMTANFFAILWQHAAADLRPALIEPGRTWRYADVLAAATARAATLQAQGIHTLATLLDNGAEWVLWDLAALQVGVVHVPIPGFYSPQQIQRTLAVSQANGLVTAADVARVFEAAGYAAAGDFGGSRLLLRAEVPPARRPEGTAKITFTSGSTGDPKGVCLSAPAMLAVAEGLHEALAPTAITRHLCALPFAVLLENIAGLYAPLLRGASCVTLPMAEVGLQGAAAFDAARFDTAMHAYGAHSVILLPQMLRAWTGWLQRQKRRAPEALAFAAVGGAAVGPALLTAAAAQGIHAFEGYGLSEGASVQTLNLPRAQRPGSVGRPLPHCDVRVAPDGELLVRGSLSAGYLHQACDTTPEGWLATGDLGHIDEDGFVHIEGRKKNVLITAFGRNVSPEWVEKALQDSPAIAQAVVLGEGLPALGAVIWPLHAGVADAAIEQAVVQANAEMPDYARVRQWVRAELPFSAEAGTATANGRPRRAAIDAAHPTLTERLRAG